MDGFFSVKEVEEASEGMKPEGAQCGDCGLFKKVQSPKMPYSGKGRKGILIVGEGPGENEDRLNKQFVGTAGEHLKDTLWSLGINLYEDCWLINAVNCRPTTYAGTNRPPTSHEIACCRPYVQDVIDQLQPKVILVLGGAPCESLFGEFYSDCSISRWRGLTIPDQDFQCWICPTFHPSYLKRQEKDDNLKAIWNLDLKRALAQLHVPFPTALQPHEHIRCLSEYADAEDLVSGLLIKPPEYMAFDYETTGLKPYFPGMKIVSISFCTYPEMNSFSLPLHYRHHFSPERIEKLSNLWMRVMINPKIKKIAHNFGFENMWTVEKFPVRKIAERYWCTKVAAHIMDDRRKYTGLKFQVYAQFGHFPYDNHIKKFLEGAGNKPNKVEQLELDELLEYNALDAYWTMQLWRKQEQYFAAEKMQDHLHQSLSDARKFFMRGDCAMMDMSIQGVRSDLPYYVRTQDEIKTEIARLTEEMSVSDEAKLFKYKFNKELDVGSPKDLQHLFFELLNLPPVRETKTGYSVDEASLEKLKHPFAKKILQKRKLEKVEGTYLRQFLRETWEGKIHTMFNLSKPRSFRSSSSKPNLHNIPVRMELAKKLTRSGIFPDGGFQFLFADYKAIEVGVAAMLSKDPNLVYYICTPGTDMHRDESCNIWMLPVEEVEKKIRFYTKNGFIFPEFYGDWYGACAEALWYNCIQGGLKLVSGRPLSDHINSKGIRSFDTFKEHMKGVEDRFWKKFGLLKKWQDEAIGFYRQHGYVRLPFGFRRGGHMKGNQIGNTPIQGTAFHLLLHTLSATHEKLEVDGARSKLLLQTHDEMTVGLWPEEYHYVRDTMNYFGTQKIREEFPWINVPLTLEFEACRVDASWYEKEEINEEGYSVKTNKKIIGERKIT